MLISDKNITRERESSHDDKNSNCYEDITMKNVSYL